MDKGNRTISFSRINWILWRCLGVCVYVTMTFYFYRTHTVTPIFQSLSFLCICVDKYNIRPLDIQLVSSHGLFYLYLFKLCTHKFLWCANFYEATMLSYSSVYQLHHHHPLCLCIEYWSYIYIRRLLECFYLFFYE